MTARRIGELLPASTAIPAIAPPDDAVCACVSKFKPQNKTRTRDTRNAESYMPSTPRHVSIVAPPLRRSNRRKSSSLLELSKRLSCLLGTWQTPRITYRKEL